MALVRASNLPDLNSGNRARDVEGLLEAIELLLQAIAPDWTDRSDSDPGVALLQVFAYFGDHFHWQADRALTDALLPKTSRRSAAVMIARALGYEVDGAAAAQVQLLFTVTPPLADGDLVIPEGTQLSGTFLGQTVTFEVDADVIIPFAGPYAVAGSATEGVSSSEALGNSNGEPYQKYRLGSNAIIQNRTQKTLVVSVAGAAWTEVSSFAESVSSDTDYLVIRDHLDRLMLVFGDGSRGKIPPPGQALATTFRLGGGVLGNVPAPTLSQTISVAYGVGVRDVVVTQSLAAVGGGPRESTESVKISAPPYFATQGRAVTSEDYSALSSAVSGVLRAQAVRTGLALVECRVVPQGWDGTVMNGALRSTIQTEVDAKRMVTDRARVLTAIAVRPRITMKVVTKARFLPAVVQRKVQQAIELLYAQADMDFGQDLDATSLFTSDLVATVDNLEGVSHVDLTTFTRVPLLLGTRSIPNGDYPDTFNNNGWDIAAGDAVLGTVTVGNATVDEVWTIEFTSATAFQLRGSVSGVQSATGTTGVAYTSDAGQVSCVISVGATAMRAGNKGRFKTSPQLGAIPLAVGEHPMYLSADLSLVVERGQGV